MTPHFTLKELTATSRKFDNTPNAAELANLQRLALFLEDVRTLLGASITINSAFRSKAVNDAVGSRDSSQHRHGCAADIKVAGMSPDQVVRTIVASDLKYDQIIREFDSWTHISITNNADGLPRKQALIIDKLGTRQFI